MVVQGHQQGVPQQRLSICSRPKVLWALHLWAVAQSVVNTAAAGAARGGRNAEVQWKCKHSDNVFRLDPGHCHHLSNPNVLIYNKWATNQSTAKKAPYWAFYDELKTTVGKYPPVWRCVGCHPEAEAALALYEQKKELKTMPKGLVRYG